MIFFAIVAAPVLRRQEVKPASLRLTRMLGVRFRALGWAALGTLIVTGTTNLYFRGIRWRLLQDRDFWSTSFGRALGCKLVLVVFVLLITLAHDLLSGRVALRALEGDPNSRRAVRAPRLASWLGRTLLLASLAIVFFATALVRGFL
jgi:putative copper export protein